MRPRRPSVATSLTFSRSATAMTEASVTPSGSPRTGASGRPSEQVHGRYVDLAQIARSYRLDEVDLGFGADVSANQVARLGNDVWVTSSSSVPAASSATG